MPRTTAPEVRNENSPIHTIRHRRIKASIWRNQTVKGIMYDVKVVRSYKDKDSDVWHDTHGFGYDDLLVVAKLMYDAHSFISALRAKDATAANAGDRKQSRR